MRAPLTGAVFAIEVTQDFRMALPLLIACAAAHGFSVLVLRRSILTEKIERRGFHVTREYAIDPLEVLFVREVMQTDAVSLPAEVPAAFVLPQLKEHSEAEAEPRRRQRLYPVLDDSDQLVGVVTYGQLEAASRAGDVSPLCELMHRDVVAAMAGETLREAVHRMADTNRHVLPVVDAHRSEVHGMVSLSDVLRSRSKHIEEERRRERVLLPSLPKIFALPLLRPSKRPPAEHGEVD